MINDPIAGYISDLNFTFMKRRGKRYTWFLIASIPCSIMFIFIFIPPQSNDLLLFLWLIITLCLLDMFFSFTIINWQALFPDKFRSQLERTKVGAYQILFSLFGLTFGLLVPTILLTSGPPGSNIESYVVVGAIISVVCILIAILMLFGMREEEEMIERTFRVEERSHSRESYFKKVKFALKQKNYTAYLFAYLAQTTVMVIMLASLPYWIQYNLKIEAFYEMIILICYLLASIASAPLWIKVARKYGNRVGYMCGTLGTAMCLLLTMFFWTFPLVILGFIMIGFFMGATWSLLYPCFSDVIDELVLKTKSREEGVFYGFRTFIGRLSIVIEAVAFGVIHPLTNFNPTAINQPIEAQWGINIIMFAIPAILYLIGFVFMWKVYDLNPPKVQENKVHLKKLQL